MMEAAVIAPGTCASGRWTVSGTTRSRSLASIITARLARVSAWRNSVWPGWAKPAWTSTALLIGAVTTAAARPSIASATASSMASVTARALAASGRPGTRRAWPRVAIMSAPLPSPQAANTEGSPMSFSGLRPMQPPSVF